MRRASPSLTLAFAVITLAGCAGGGAGTGSVPEPEVERAPPGEPEPPQLTLAERWAAPFAVVSSGRPAAPRPGAAAGGRSEADVRSRGTSPSWVEVADRPAATDELRAGATGSRPDAAGSRPDATGSRPDATGSRPDATGSRPDAAGSDRSDPRTDASSGTDGGGSRVDREPARSAGTIILHHVEWGDTWFGIARRYSVTREALAAANPTIDPDRLRAGSVLRVPAAADAEVRMRTHTVGMGDTLWNIARRYGTAIDAIRDANGLDDDRVRIGQVLLIPGT